MTRPSPPTGIDSTSHFFYNFSPTLHFAFLPDEVSFITAKPAQLLFVKQVQTLFKQGAVVSVRNTQTQTAASSSGDVPAQQAALQGMAINL